MGRKSTYIYVCLNNNDRAFLEETNLEEVLDVEERKDAPLRTGNLRKSIEHYMERQKLKENIADFFFKDKYEEH